MSRHLGFLLVLLLAPPVRALDYTTHLRHLAHLDTPSPALDVTTTATLALTATETALLIHDLSSTILLSSTPIAARRIVATADVAHVATADTTLHTYDLADPAAPVLVTVTPLPAPATGLALHGDHLLATTDDAGLVVLDRAGPHIVAVLDTPGFAQAVAASSSLAAIADGPTGLFLAELADPRRPRPLAKLEFGAAALDVALAGPLAHLACGLDGLQTIDISDPGDPAPLSSLPLPGIARRVTAAGDLTFTAAAGLCVADPSPRLIGRAATFAAPRAVALTATTAIVASSAGLDIYDRTNPASVPPLSVTATAGRALGIAVSGHLAYLAADGLRILDTADPAAPRTIADVPLDGAAIRIALAAGHAYVTTAGSTGTVLRAIDLATSSVVATLALPGFPGPLLAHGTALYLGDVLQGVLLAVDISDPAHPRLTATVPTPPYVIGLAAHDRRLFVGTGAFGGAALHAFDITNPRVPALLVSRSLGTEAVPALVATDGLIIAGLGGVPLNGLATLDAATLEQVGFVPVPDRPAALRLAGSCAYLATEPAFLHVLDIADPAHPARIGETFLPDNAYDIALGPETVHAAATDVGLVILPQHTSGSTSVLDPPPGDPVPRADIALSAYPNPFNPQVTVAFSLPRAEHVAVTVHDLAGRRLATLADGGLEAGPHALVWDGTDTANRARPSGVYLARLAGESLERSVKLVLVR